MSADKFLDLDINKLFEEYTIKDIELIQKQIQNESDRKKIELRTLVGERYRDLIQAADSIAEMKRTSETVIEKIINIEKTFHDLQQKYLIGFKMEPQEIITQKPNSTVSDSVVMQIKILMDIPEQIWSSIDAQDYLLATQIFLLAQHIHYSLTFEVGDINLAKKYPIVSKQWGIINQFKNLILNFCNDSLQSQELTKELAANCLSALVLLDGLNSSELLNRLISLRCKTIQSIVVFESELSAKSRIKLCLKVLMDTIPLLSNCFLKHKDLQDGLVYISINDIKDKNAFFMMSKLDLDKELMDKFLPILVKNHKLFVQTDLQKLPLTYIQEHVKSWFEWVRQLATVEVAKLLNLITSIKGIYNIREECLAVDIPENWDCSWEAISLNSVNFWTEFFQPLLTNRVKGILNDKLNVCSINLKKEVVEFLNKVGYENVQYPENDLRWFVWKELPTDIPQKLMEGGFLDSKRPLLMKVRGFSPNLLELCESFDSGLSEVLLHLKQYLYELEKMSTFKDDSLATDIYLTSNKFCDRNEIQEYLQTISEALIDDFVSFVKNECTIENPKIGTQEINLIVTARFLQAIPTVCLNLKECFTISRPTGLTLTNIKWQEICDKLKQKSTTIWFDWSKCFSKKIIHHRNTHLIKETEDELRVYAIITDWEKVIIEEEAGEGKRINSEILVPYQPAVHLQKFLAFICQDLNKVVPHTIPKTVLNEIIKSIAQELLDYYQKLSTNLEIRQKQAIQILFDVKYFTLLMILRDNKSLVDQSNKVCNNIISKIDPFDFDVFYPFINTNVKKAVQRSLLIFGNLVPHMEQLHSILGARIEHGEGIKSIKDPPGVLALCSGAPWFPPLAITAPAKNVPTVSNPPSDKTQQKKKNQGKEHTRNDSSGSTIKSGAATFFGSIGSDWFGSS